MKKKKILEGAEKFGIKVKIDKSLDKYSGIVLFPKQVEKGKKILAKLYPPLP